MKKMFSALTASTLYDGTFLLIYLSILLTLFLNLLPAGGLMGLPLLPYGAAAILLLLLYRLRVLLLPIPQHRLIQLLLSAVLAVSFGFNLFCVFRVVYAWGLLTFG